ncbi:MAG: hypothetical protein AAF466_07165 [Bacteroidota bacterium]
MKKLIPLIFFFGIITGLHANTEPLEKKFYAKEYYPDGTLQAEGWVMGDMKSGYWKMYHPNGKIASRGHFRNNKKNNYWHYYNVSGKLIKEGHYKDEFAEDWWIFYDLENSKTLKIQYKMNRKHGYALRYNKRKLVLVERFDNNKKMGEWTSVVAFKLDNPGVTW